MASIKQLTFELNSEFIPLDSLLKACGAAESGGRAKTMVTEGMIQVDGREELRKTCKIRAGQVVSLSGMRIHVVAAGIAAVDSATQAGQ